MANKRFKSEALQYTYEQLVGNDPQRQAEVEQEIIHVEAAQLIHDMRAHARDGAEDRCCAEPAARAESGTGGG
jgi:hypothetical protein